MKHFPFLEVILWNSAQLLRVWLSKSLTHSLTLSQSKLNTSENSASTPLGSRSWTGHMRATGVLLWRRCRAAIWITHGWDHPGGGLQGCVFHPGSLAWISARNSCYQRLELTSSAGKTSPHQRLLQYFYPSSFMCLFQEYYRSGTLPRMNCSMPRICCCFGSTEKMTPNIHHHYRNYYCDCCLCQQKFLTK